MFKTFALLTVAALAASLLLAGLPLIAAVAGPTLTTLVLVVPTGKSEESDEENE